MNIFNDASRLHLFICTNDRCGIVGNTKPSCVTWITEMDIKTLKEWVRMSGYGGEVIVTRSGCLGYCNENGGVMCVYPKGFFVRGLKSIEDVKNVIISEMK